MIYRHRLSLQVQESTKDNRLIRLYRRIIYMNDIYDKEPKGYMYFSKELFPEDTSNIVMHNVSGDGMFNAGIYDGDCLIFDKSLMPQNRDVVSATIDDRLVCRRILINDGVVSFR